jgi:hypothetical protein
MLDSRFVRAAARFWWARARRAHRASGSSIDPASGSSSSATRPCPSVLELWILPLHLRPSVPKLYRSDRRPRARRSPSSLDPATRPPVSAAVPALASTRVLPLLWPLALTSLLQARLNRPNSFNPASRQAQYHARPAQLLGLGPDFFSPAPRSA